MRGLKRELDGFVLIDKPAGPTCRRVLDALQRSLGMRGLGHAGTLDPLASGLLIVLLGRAVRLQSHFMQGRKRYVAEVRFGYTSASDDAEGPIVPSGTPPADLLTAVQAILPQFLGAHQQQPPAISALRVQGKRAWQSARAGEPLVLPARSITIHSVDAEVVSSDVLRLSVECSSGTYIRSFARDLGQRLGCGAYVASLRRTHSGALDVKEARAAESITAADVRPIGEALTDCGRVDVDLAVALRLHQGAVLKLELPDTTAPTFAWHDGTPFCRLLRLEEGVRSDGTLLPSSRCPASAQEFAHYFEEGRRPDESSIKRE